MNNKLALKLISGISLFGVLFSGVLTYRELFGGVVSCQSPGAPGTILGYPPCIYGLIVYLIIFVISTLGLAGSGRKIKS